MLYRSQHLPSVQSRRCKSMYHLTYRFSHHLLVAESGFKSGYVGKSKYRNFKSVTEFYELCAFLRPSGRKSSVGNLCLITISVVRLTSVCNCTNSSSVQAEENLLRYPVRKLPLSQKNSPLSAILERAMAVSPVQPAISSHTLFRSSVHSLKLSLSSLFSGSMLTSVRICPRISSSVPMPSTSPVSLTLELCGS